MVLLEFSISPLDKGESLSPYIARIIDIIDRSGISYRLTPMGTILEGEWDNVIHVVGACFKELETDCHRIGMNLKIDYRKGNDSRLDKKIRSVEEKLGRTVSKY